MTLRTHDRDYFATMYEADPDPWNFRSSPYEQAKYATTHAAIADRRYGAALEIGCSIGELSARIAPRCDDFLGMDIVEAPLVVARERCAKVSSARFRCGALPADWPTGRFDLIILSEVLYFFVEPDIERLAQLSRAALTEGGRILLVNWLGAAEAPQPGDLAADCFIAAVRCPVLHAKREDLYRLDLLGSS